MFKGKVEISADSTLVLGGKAGNTPIDNMQLDGTIKAHTPFNFFKHFEERYIVFVPAEAADNEFNAC